jgi:predicted Zn-dependent peptidase
VDYVFHPYFTEKNVEKEVGIIGQEIKMYEDSSSSRLYMAMMECLYQNHGIRTNICGTVETISAITPELLTRCYRAFYRPDNMILTVCGDVTTAEVLRIVDEVLPATREAAPAVICEYPEEPTAVYKKSCEFHMDIARPKLCVGIKDPIVAASPAARERRSIIMNLIGDLCFGESSPFYERLYNAGLISRDFSACYESVKGGAHMLFSAATDQPEQLLSELRNEFSRLSSVTVISEQDFCRLRNVHYAEFIKDFDNTEEIAADLLDAVLEGTELFDTGNVIRSVTSSELLDLLHSFFREEQLAYVTIKPINGRNTNA